MIAVTSNALFSSKAPQTVRQRHGLLPDPLRNLLRSGLHNVAYSSTQKCSFTPSLPGLGRLFAVHPQLRPGPLPSVPVLGRPPAVRPDLDRGSIQPSPRSTALLAVRTGLDRGFRRPSPASACLSPFVPGFDQACRRP